MEALFPSKTLTELLQCSRILMEFLLCSRILMEFLLSNKILMVKILMEVTKEVLNLSNKRKKLTSIVELVRFNSLIYL
jgi:hypothetical protein